MNRMTRVCCVLLAMGAIMSLTGATCDPNLGDISNDNSNSGGFTPVRTQINAHPQGRIQAGDDVVFYGFDGANGVDYIIPSAGDVVGRGIPNAESYVSYSFAVAGRRAFLVDNSLEASVFDADTGNLDTLPLTEITLKNIPSSQYEKGHVQADGDFCAVICEETEVTDGKIVKVIDASGANPQVISFTQNPAPTAEQVEQVAVHAASGLVAVEAAGKFYIFDINDPTAAGVEFDAVAAGIGDLQMAFDGERILYADDSATFNAIVLDLATGDNLPLAENPAAGRRLALANGSFGYFLSNNSVGAHFRSAIGVLDAGISATLTTVTTAALDDFIDGSTPNNGLVGYGSTITVTADGSRWFIAGDEDIGSGDYLQTSTGGAFTVVPDPLDQDELGCPATDVHASANTVAFKTGEGSEVKVGYIILD